MAYLKIKTMKSIAITLIETLGFEALALQMQTFGTEKCVEIAKQLTITTCENKMYLIDPITRVKTLNPDHENLKTMIKLAGTL